MRGKIGPVLGILGVLILTSGNALAEPNTGGGSSSIHDCAGVAKTCGAWGAKGANTCRPCQQAQCRTENGKDVLAGNKTTTECYDGHGSPPKGIQSSPSSRLPLRDTTPPLQNVR